MKLSLCFAIVATTILLLGATSFAQQQEEENKQVELGFVLQHPDFSFFPRHHGGGVGLPPLSPTTDDEIKCFRAVHARGMLSCLKDLRSFFTSHKMSISTGCCSALENIEKTCKHESLFLKNLVSQQCSIAPSPSS